MILNVVLVLQEEAGEAVTAQLEEVPGLLRFLLLTAPITTVLLLFSSNLRFIGNKERKKKKKTEEQGRARLPVSQNTLIVVSRC